jgi:hypothetical protein
MKRISLRDSPRTLFYCLVVSVVVVFDSGMAQQPPSSGVPESVLQTEGDSINSSQPTGASEELENDQLRLSPGRHVETDSARIEINQQVLDHLYDRVKNYDSGIFNYEKKIN